MMDDFSSSKVAKVNDKEVSDMVQETGPTLLQTHRTFFSLQKRSSIPLLTWEVLLESVGFVGWHLKEY